MLKNHTEHQLSHTIDSGPQAPTVQIAADNCCHPLLPQQAQLGAVPTKTTKPPDGTVVTITTHGIPQLPRLHQACCTCTPQNSYISLNSCLTVLSASRHPVWATEPLHLLTTLLSASYASCCIMTTSLPPPPALAPLLPPPPLPPPACHSINMPPQIPQL